MRRVTGAGQLKHYVQLQESKEQQDAGGHPEGKPRTVAKLWVAIHPVSGDERQRGIQIEAGVTTIVTGHFREGVTPGMRFVEGKRVLNITRAYDRDDDHIWLECQCKETVSV